MAYELQSGVVVCVEGIVNFMKERSGSHSKPLSEAMLVLTKNNFTKFTAKQELTVVIFYAAWLAGFLGSFPCLSVGQTYILSVIACLVCQLQNK